MGTSALDDLQSPYIVSDQLYWSVLRHWLYHTILHAADLVVRQFQGLACVTSCPNSAQFVIFEFCMTFAIFEVL